MPQAPQAQRQVFDAPFPNVRVQAAPTSETYGGQIGDTVSHAGVRAYDLLTREANQTAVFEADRAMADKQTELENTLYSTKGRDALGADTALKQQFTDHAATISESLSNDQQRAAFQHTTALRLQQFNAKAQSHIRTSFSQYQNEVDAGTMQSAKDRIRQDPANIALEMPRALSAFAAAGARSGHAGPLTDAMVTDPVVQAEYTSRGESVPTSEEVKAGAQYYSPTYRAKRAELVSSLHREVVNGFLAKDQDRAAKEYFTANKSKFTAADLDGIEKQVLEGSTRGESRRLVDQIVTTHGIDTPEQRQAALAAARKPSIDDKVSDLAVQRLHQQFAETDQRKQEGYTQRFEAASKVLEQQAFQRPNALVRDLIPVPMWNNLKPADQASLELHLARIRKPADHAHDPKAWFDFQALTDTQLANVKPETLMGTYLNRFDGTHYDRALNEWNAARNKQEKGDASEKFVSALSNRERIKNAWTESNIVDNSISRSKWTAQDEVNYSRFESEADKALSALPKGAKPEEIQKVLHSLSDSLLKQKYAVNPGGIRGFFGITKDVPAIAIPDVKDLSGARVSLKDIPADRQDVLRGALRQAGVPITDQAIQELEAKARLKRQGIGRP